MHIQREGTEQIVFQQLAQLQTGRFHIAQHTATAVAQQAHLQQAGRTADLGRQRSIRSKGRERSVEFAGKTDFARIFAIRSTSSGKFLPVRAAASRSTSAAEVVSSEMSALKCPFPTSGSPCAAKSTDSFVSAPVRTERSDPDISATGPLTSAFTSVSVRCQSFILGEK